MLDGKALAKAMNAAYQSLFWECAECGYGQGPETDPEITRDGMRICRQCVRDLAREALAKREEPADCKEERAPE